MARPAASSSSIPKAHRLATPRPAVDRSGRTSELPQTRDQRPLEHSPVSSNLPTPPQKTLARVARRAKRDVSKVGEYERQRLFKQLEASGQLTTFVDKSAAFRDAVMTEANALSERLVKFLLAKPTYVYNDTGTPKLILPEDVALTDQQMHVLKVLLDKFVPAQKPMDATGKQDTAPRKVSIFVNTAGAKPDYEKLPGGSDGLSLGAAKRTSVVRFGSAPGDPAPALEPSPAQPPIIDVVPEE